jgi:hypothetical protein
VRFQKISAAKRECGKILRTAKGNFQLNTWQKSTKQKNRAGLTLLFITLATVMASGQISLPADPPYLVLGEAQVVSTSAQRLSQGFEFGYVDGVMGGVKDAAGRYQYFGSAKSDPSTCTLSNAAIQGVYPLSSSADDPVHTFSAKCTALLQPSGKNPGVLPAKGPIVITGPYDRDYLGGGPALTISDGTHTGILITYHSEFQYFRNPTPKLANIFFGTLGMAVSIDNGKTFRKLGQIIQPHPSRPDWIRDFGSTSLSIGNGPFVLGDEQCVPVAPENADPEKTYLYIYFNDYDLNECGGQQCLAVARAKLADVIRLAFGNGDQPKAFEIFRKYYKGGFTEPAATSDANNAIPSGHYTHVLQDAFSASIIYEPASHQAVLATQAGKKGIEFRASSDLAKWPVDPIAAITDDPPPSTVRYPSLLEIVRDEPGAKPQLWIFYSRGDGVHASWPNTDFMARTIQVIPATK